MWMKILGVLQRESIIKPKGVLLLLFIITVIIERIIFLMLALEERVE